MYSSGNADKPVAIATENDTSTYHSLSLLGAGSWECVGHEAIEQVGLFREDGFVLRNLLSSAECENVIRQAEAIGMCAPPESHRMRLCDRVKIMDEELAAELFKRALPHLADIQVRDSERPRGIPPGVKQGLWTPSQLNPCFRVCRYDMCGFFLPHHDGDFVQSSKKRSLKTFMVYLNDDFDGGATNFYHETQEHYAKADPGKVLLSYQPERGSCLVFNHDITHDGGHLRDGWKYILRTEVVYEHHYLDDSESIAATFLQRVSSLEEMCCFGINNTVSALDNGAVDTLIIWEDLDILRLLIRNPDESNEISVKFSSPQEVPSPQIFNDPETGTQLPIIENERFVDWLNRMTAGTTTTLGDWSPGMKVTFVSEQSKAERQFVHGFGGIGALLRHPMSFQDVNNADVNAVDSDEDFA